MIVTMPDTTTIDVDARLLSLREEGGVVALGRVLTLIILTSNEHIETAIQAANEASREHSCRVIVITTSPAAHSPGPVDTAGRLDAEVRIGADAGASEVVVLSPVGEASPDVDTLVNPLLLPDAPIVVWWPHEPPEALSEGLLGQLSQRRISDSLASADPISTLRQLARTYSPGDTDLSWARTTLWRGLTAATLDVLRGPAVAGVVHGNSNHPSVLLYAGWLRHGLRIPIRVQHEQGATALTGATLHLESGQVRLQRPEGESVLAISIPGHTDQHVSLPMRRIPECLIEDLRRLDPDDTYAAALAAIFDVEVP